MIIFNHAITINDIIQFGVLAVMVYTYKSKNDQDEVKEHAQENLSIDKNLKNAMKKLANAEGEIEDLFKLDIKDVPKDFLKEEVYDVISTLNYACYYYKKTHRDIKHSKDFWVPRFRFYSEQKLFQTAFDKYSSLNYEDSMYVLFKKTNPKKIKRKRIDKVIIQTNENVPNYVQVGLEKRKLKSVRLV